MSVCTLCESNWLICLKKYYAITIKHFFSERCTSTASKIETATRDFLRSSSKVACCESLVNSLKMFHG